MKLLFVCKPNDNLFQFLPPEELILSLFGQSFIYFLEMGPEMPFVLDLGAYFAFSNAWLQSFERIQMVLRASMKLKIQPLSKNMSCCLKINSSQQQHFLFSVLPNFNTQSTSHDAGIYLVQGCAFIQGVFNFWQKMSHFIC